MHCLKGEVVLSTLTSIHFIVTGALNGYNVSKGVQRSP